MVKYCQLLPLQSAYIFNCMSKKYSKGHFYIVLRNIQFVIHLCLFVFLPKKCHLQCLLLTWVPSLLCFHLYLKPLFPGPLPTRRSIQRTLSDESIYGGQREPSSSGQRDTPTDLLFSCSTMPRSPTTRHGASRRASHKSLGKSSVFTANHRGGWNLICFV